MADYPYSIAIGFMRTTHTGSMAAQRFLIRASLVQNNPLWYNIHLLRDHNLTYELTILAQRILDLNIPLSPRFACFQFDLKSVTCLADGSYYMKNSKELVAFSFLRVMFSVKSANKGVLHLC